MLLWLRLPPNIKGSSLPLPHSLQGFNPRSPSILLQEVSRRLLAFSTLPRQLQHLLCLLLQSLIASLTSLGLASSLLSPGEKIV